MSIETQTKEMAGGEPVHALQVMLRDLSNQYDFLPRLTPDGVFGEETLEAVMLFQREFSSPVTGVVDEKTRQAIYGAWERQNRAQPVTPMLWLLPHSGHVVAEGGEDLRLVLPQTMLQILGTIVEGIEPHPPSGRHEGESVRNIKWLQKRAMLAPTGRLDQETWEMLSRLYEVLITRLGEVEDFG